MDERPNRKCAACGHVHPYETPIYRCDGCGVWGQDFYELKPLGWFYRLRLRLRGIRI